MPRSGFFRTRIIRLRNESSRSERDRRGPLRARGEATRAHVTYDLTGLGDPLTVDHFADDFPAMLAEWERLIAASLT